MLTTVQSETYRDATITVLLADSERFGRLYTTRTSLDDFGEPRCFTASMPAAIAEAQRYIDWCLD